MSSRRLLLPVLAVLALASLPLRAEIARGSLEVRGSGLQVVTDPITAGINIPVTVQTIFGGKQNDQAATVPGLLAVGDLSGPGLDTPITLTTAPGHRFQIPGLAQEGIYTLQNIRLMNGSVFLQPAVPSAIQITVADLLKTAIRVRQLTPDEIRARGIVVDASNFDVYEYTFSFIVDGKLVEVPFTVLVDPRTHEARPLTSGPGFTLPPPPGPNQQPPRWTPPAIVTTVFDEDNGGGPPPDTHGSDAIPTRRVKVPAALVIPNSLAVLHQFFAVILTVTNGAPNGSVARLEDITATMKVPAALRTVKSTPAVAFGQAVPITDSQTGVTFLVAQARGEIDWTLEGLHPGTHTIEVDLRATLRQTGQADIPLVAAPRASIVVHDARFNLTFSHPDTVEKGQDYSTLTFVTNISGSPQTVRIANGVQSCDLNPNANVCRVGGNDFDELTLASGQTGTVEYKLRSGVTGSVFATSATVDDTQTINAAVQLTMGVSASGIPLSPDSLVFPYYAQFVNPDFVAASMPLFGLGYSLATAPTTQATAKFPNVIQTDVFYRVVDIARAGHYTFVANGDPNAKRDAMANLALDLLGNAVPLGEWDALRRQEKNGHAADAALTRELESTGLAGGATIPAYVDAFAAATSHRGNYLLALVHGAGMSGKDRPYALSIRGGTTGGRLDVVNEAASGWVRELPYGDLSHFSSSSLGRTGELALIGRWSEDLQLTIAPAVTGTFSLELIYPGTADGSHLRAHLDFNATAGDTITIPLQRGAMSILPDRDMTLLTGPAAVALADLVSVAARQDLHLDPNGHKVTLLFNRPVAVAAGVDPLTKFSGAIAFNRDGVVYNGRRGISAAALQADANFIDLTFDQTLTQNASYTVNIAPLVDPLKGAGVTFPQAIVPKIDNDRPAGIIYGKFIRGDNTPIGGVDVFLYSGHPVFGSASSSCVTYLDDNGILRPCNPFIEPGQVVTTDSDGTYLFEFIRRDTLLDPLLNGSYRLFGVAADGTFTYLDGAVRLPGRVEFVNLQFLGRGSVEGTVRYDNGDPVSNARVVVGSTLFGSSASASSDSNGAFHVNDLPVGPLTISATDAGGNVGYASVGIATPGQVVEKDVSIFRKPSGGGGTGTVFGQITRSDTGAGVAGAQVGVYTDGFGVVSGTTDADGRYSFTKVPSGFVTVLAAEWSISRVSSATDFDLRPDETRELNLILSVNPAEPTATLNVTVLRENPVFPGDASKFEQVPAALVRIEHTRAVTADGAGLYKYDSIPVSFSGRNISAYDPSTKRTSTVGVPTLSDTTPTSQTILIRANDYGTGKVHLKLLDARGVPAVGFAPLGFAGSSDPQSFSALGGGVYELQNVKVGVPVGVYAVNGPTQYGDQFVSGETRVEFDGHVAALSLRLPGQGTVRVGMRSDIDLIGDVTVTYDAWDLAVNAAVPKVVTGTTLQNGAAGLAVFTVPALEGYKVTGTNPDHGYAEVVNELAFDGDIATHILQLSRLVTIRGTVFAIDGTTPIPNAAVHIQTVHQDGSGTSDPGVFVAGPDGSFEFRNIASNCNSTITAEATQSGIYRIGRAFVSTPVNGGVVSNVRVILLQRGSVQGKLVYKDYKVYDPLHPANNVPDNTPNDLSDNAPVPLGLVILRELDFPGRSFGTPAEPLRADINGNFQVNNVFVGSLKANGFDPGNPDLKGDWAGRLDHEGQNLGIEYVPIGGGGTGQIHATVIDPNSGSPVVNAEVSLYRNGVKYDLQSSGPDGTALFDLLPVDSTYQVGAYSKALGKSGRPSSSVSVTRDGRTEVTIILEFSGKVDGHLMDPESTPPNRGIPGAVVSLNSDEELASTDLLGAFSFDGIREGTFTLDAKDTTTNRRAHATHNLSAADPHPIVDLLLEPTETLNFSVGLPNDAGNDSGQLAGPVQIDVTQRCYDVDNTNCDFHRALQGNPIVMPKMLRNTGYSIELTELGGQGRHFFLGGDFPHGSASDPYRFVYPAFGTGSATVTQGGVPASGARVVFQGVFGGSFASAFTDSSGHATVVGLPLHLDMVVVASTVDGFSGTAPARVDLQSVPVSVHVDLGAYAGVTGLVLAQAGGPSVGTRVIADYQVDVSSPVTRYTVLTDSNGRYTFQGIVTSAQGVTVNLTYMSPDDITVGARQSKVLFNDSARLTVTVPAVKLDGTAPELVSMVPADGAGDVAPDAPLSFVFNKAIDPHFETTTYFALQPVDAPITAAATFSHATNPDGSYVVTMTPLLPMGQRFPLLSNTLYRVVVSGSITDRTGNPLPAARGETFTTVDYVEPHVVKVVPDITLPIPKQVTFEFRFNKPIDPAAWQSGGDGQFHLYKISAAGAAGTVIREITGHVSIDPATGASLFFGPDENMEPESFYRIVFSGVRDLRGNQLNQQTYHFVSYSEVKPVLSLVSPVQAGVSLVSGTTYDVVPDIRKPTASGSAATDVARVEYVPGDGMTAGVKVVVATAPYNYHFVAPEAPPTGRTLTLQGIAYDTSGNASDPVNLSWSVKQNAPPAGVTITPSAAMAYPGTKIQADVGFDDEGLLVTVQVDVDGTKSDGSAYHGTTTQAPTRASYGVPWAHFITPITLPATLKAGSSVTLTATVTDARGLVSTATASVAILTDTNPPAIVAFSPTAESHFAFGSKYDLNATVTDAESGVAEVDFVVDGQTIHVLAGSSGNIGSAFLAGKITVPAKNDDTISTITIVATDFQGNIQRRSFDVVYVGVHDPSLPVGTWVCPVEGSVLPASMTPYPVRLRVRATDSIAITAVTFTVPGITDPVPATSIGNNLYEAMVDIGPQTDLTIIANVSNADPAKTQQVPMPITVVAVDTTITTTQAILDENLTSFQDKSIAVRAMGQLVPHVPVRFKNLLVLDGGIVTSLGTTTTLESRLDLTVTDHLYVDCFSSVDVSAKGYLGAYTANADGSGSNSDGRGITLGNTLTGGATFADGSYAGNGGIIFARGLTDINYGSLTNPTDLGSGGASNDGNPGGTGGGAVALRGAAGSQITIAGGVHANGQPAGPPSSFDFEGRRAAGSGGSVLIAGDNVVIGTGAAVSANGGDATARFSFPAGGGGGRVAIASITHLVTAQQAVTAFGGHNGNPDFLPEYPDAGAGTVFVRFPGETNGELFVSNGDPRFPTTVHPTLGTPIGRTSPVAFDAIHIGPRSLVRFDSAYTVPDPSLVTVDPTSTLVTSDQVPLLSVTTDPAPGASLAQGQQVLITYHAVAATSRDGIASVRAILSAAQQDGVTTYSAYPSMVASDTINIQMPFDAPIHTTATLKVRLTTRSGRVVEAPVTTFPIVENTPPQITRFNLTPSNGQSYAGHKIDVVTTAIDDQNVTQLYLTSSVGTVTSDDLVQDTPHQVSRHFTVDIPPNTAAGSQIALILNAGDDFPGHDLVTQTKTVTIQKDTTPPALTLTLPVANSEFATGNSFTVEATIIEAETGVQRAWATLAGQETNLAPAPGRPNVWTAQVQVPNASGMQSLVVKAIDWEPTNPVASVTVPVQIIGASRVDITAAQTDANFHARTLARSGTTLVVADRSQGGSNKIAIFDVTNPAAPQFVRSIDVGLGGIVDVKIHQGNALVLSRDRLSVVNLSDDSVISTALIGPGTAVAGSGNYILTASGTTLSIYALSDLTHVTDQDLQLTIDDLVPSGADPIYVIASTPRPIYTYLGDGAMAVTGVSQGYVSQNNWLQITDFHPVRGRVLNGLLYLAGDTGGLALVDTTRSWQLSLLTRAEAPGTSHGIDAIRSLTATANDDHGATLFAGLPPNDLTSLGALHADGSRAWDVLFNDTVLYIADETGFAIINRLPPTVDLSRISMVSDGIAGTAQITGLAGAVAGSPPMSVSVTRDSGATSVDTAVNADGSFMANLTVSVGDTVTMTAAGGGYRVGPFTIGLIPDGRTVPIGSTISDANFLAGMVRLGGNTLAVAGSAFSFSQNTGRSQKIVLFDVTNPVSPAYRSTVTLPTGNVNDFLVSGGYLFAGGATKDSQTTGLTVFDLHDGSAVFTENESGILLTALARVDAYLFAAYSATNPDGYSSRGVFKVWDVSDPRAPRLVSKHDLDWATYRQILVYGADSLILISDKISILDRRELGAGSNADDAKPATVANLFFNDASQARIDGSTLYVLPASHQPQVTAIDLSDLRHPTVARVVDLTAAGLPVSFDVRGGQAFLTIADGHLVAGSLAGTTFTPVQTKVLSGTPLGDVALGTGAAYLANGSGLIVLPEDTAPAIDVAGVTVARASGGATVTGAPGSVRAAAPAHIEVRNEISGQTVSNIAVAADGSFSATVTGDAANSITVMVTDAVNRSTPRTLVGAVAIGDATTAVTLPDPVSSRQLVRQLAVSGQSLVVTGDGSDDALIYDISDPTTPSLVTSTNLRFAPNASILSGGLLYFANVGQIGSMDLSNPTSTSIQSLGLSVASMATAGANLFLASKPPSSFQTPAGTVNVFAIDGSGQLSFQQGFDLLSGATFTKILPYGANYLIALTPDEPNGTEHDVVIIDRHDLSALTIAAELAIPELKASTGAISGNRLYIAGREGGFAVVDLTNPLAPARLGFVATSGGLARSMSVSGTRVAVATANAGVALFDVTNPLAPVYNGSEPAGEYAYDVAFSLGHLLVARETHFDIHRAVTAAPPPDVNASAIVVSAANDTAARVVGARGAVNGVSPLTTVLRNVASGLTTMVTIGPGGSFTTQIAATAGDELTLTPTDGRGMSGLTVSLGLVPAFVPAIDLSKVALLSDGATNALVSGTAGAVNGAAPVVMTARNQTNVAVGTSTAAADGSFTVSVAAATGDQITIEFTDARNRLVGPYDLGPAPWATSQSRINILQGPQSLSIYALFAGSGKLLAGAQNSNDGSLTPAVLDISHPEAPVFERLLDPIDYLNKVAFGSGWAYIASGNSYGFRVLSLTSSATPMTLVPSSTGNDVLDLAVVGQHLFVAPSPNFLPAPIDVYDLTNPGAPALVGTDSSLISDSYIYRLIPLDATHIVAMTNSDPSFVIIDVHDPAHLAITGRYSSGIPFWTATISGRMLFGVDYNNMLSKIDLTDPANPMLIGQVSPGPIGGYLKSSATLVGIPHYDQTVALIDATAPGAPAIMSQQGFPDPVNDIAFGGSNLYIGDVHGLLVLSRHAAVHVDPSLIVVTAPSAMTATITGSAGAVIGDSPLTVDVKNETTGELVSSVPVADDGSFNATITASEGASISVKAIDGHANIDGPKGVGNVPAVGSNKPTVPTVPPAPSVVATRITVLATSASQANVVASIGAVRGGKTPVTAKVTNTTTGTAASPVNVAADGSFTVSIAASSGQTLSLLLSDSLSRTVTVSLGRVPPFALPLTVDATHLTVTAASASQAGVIATIGAVKGGKAPLTAKVTNTTTRTVASPVNVAANGSFSVSIVATSGQALSLQVIDALRRTVTVPLGTVPAFGAPPTVDATHITVTATSTAQASVVATIGAVKGGKAPVTAKVTNTTTGTAASPATVSADGSFTVSLAASSGQALSLLVSDSLSRTVTVSLGTVPAFAAPPTVDATHLTVTATSASQASVLATIGAVKGGKAPVTAKVTNTTTGTAASPVTVAADGSFTVSVAATSGQVLSLVVTDSLSRSVTVSLGPVPAFVAPPTVDATHIAVTATSASQASVVAATGAISGGKAPVTAKVTNTATSSAASPVTVAADGSFTVSIAATSGQGLSLLVTDALSRSVTVSLGTVPAFAGPPTVDATHITVTATSASQANVVATIGAVGGGKAPVTAKVTNTTTGTAAAPVTVAADGSFTMSIAASSGQALSLLVTDALSRTVTVSLGTVPAFAAPPTVDATHISVTATSASQASIVATPGAISGGKAPVTAKVTNTTTSTAAAPVTVAADGSFTASIAATSGQALSLVVTDALSRSVTVSLGMAPAFVAPLAVDATHISVTAKSASQASVVATLGAVSGGKAPVTATVTNTTSSAAASPVTVAADGSFSVSITATSGQTLSLTVSDALNHSVTLSLGTVPVLNAPPPAVDTNKIALTGDGASVATLTGAAGAVTGSGAITIVARNVTRTVDGAPVVAAADGSFTAHVSASAGDQISVIVTDANAHTGPQTVGPVPFGSGVQEIPITAAQTEATFRARTLAGDGSRLVVAGYPSGGTGGSTRIVSLDVTTASTPQNAKTFTVTGTTPVSGIALAGGHALVAAGVLTSIDLANGNATVATGGTGAATAIALAGSYAFVASDSNETGTIRVYDLTDPAAPRFLGEQVTFAQTGLHYRSLVSLPGAYLAALSPDITGARGHDVVILDARDPMHLQVVTDIDIPAITAFRGTAVGTTLYVAGQNGGLAIVDCTTPATPVVKLVATAHSARGVSLAGGTAAVADDTSGVSFLDTAALTSRLIGTQSVAGTAWDVLFDRGELYVADESGVAVIHNVAAPPAIDSKRVALSLPASGQVTVTGASSSIAGHSPIALQLQNGMIQATATPAANGSFQSSIAARSGDLLTLSATDNATRIAKRGLGQVPFATPSATIAAGVAVPADTNFVARRLAADATLVAVTGTTIGSSTSTSNTLLIVVQPNVNASLTLAGDQGIEDVALDNGWAFTSSARFDSIDLHFTPAVVHSVTGLGARTLGMVISGNSAFLSEGGGNGTIAILDVTSRSAPKLVREQAGIVAGVSFRRLLRLDATHIVAITPDQAAGRGHDVVIIDTSKPKALTVVSDFDIPKFDAVDGTLDGTTLYVTGGDAGVAIVDLAQPTMPAWKATLDTPGIAHGVAVSGSNEIAVADGAAGITFIDTTDKQHPVVLGSQSTPGNAVDIRVVAHTLYVATEQHIYQLNRP